VNWVYFGLIFYGVMIEKLYQWIRRWALGKKHDLPYSWVCTECFDSDGISSFTCSSNDIEALDRIINEHKKNHGGIT
jgi:hypothetical protein